MRHIILMLLIGVGSVMMSQVQAQNLPERREVRRGNDSFLDEDYEKAAEYYVRAMEYAPDNYEARYNLGSALIKGGDLESGEKLLAELAADSLLSDAKRSIAYFNLGNSQFEQQKLEEALESYKNAMRYDHTDQEAKYNYAYTKALLEQQEQDQEQNEDQQDQDQNENQDQNEDQNEDQQDGDGDSDQEQNEDQQDQDQDEGEDEQDQGGGQDEQEQDQDQGGEQPQEGGISEQEQAQMLDAIQAQEDKTQEDLKEKAAGVVIPGAKNW
ncbi:MAG: tetratricopeptide repeat protein [Rikenellaceae bacterium]